MISITCIGCGGECHIYKYPVKDGWSGVEFNEYVVKCTHCGTIIDINDVARD